jgi:hypothetical protein
MYGGMKDRYLANHDRVHPRGLNALHQSSALSSLSIRGAASSSNPYIDNRQSNRHHSHDTPTETDTSLPKKKKKKKKKTSQSH